MPDKLLANVDVDIAFGANGNIGVAQFVQVVRRRVFFENLRKVICVVIKYFFGVLALITCAFLFFDLRTLTFKRIANIVGNRYVSIA